MAWNNRLREAAYTSPSGNRILFSYENVKQSFDKKTTGFEFPDANGTFVQDLGHTGRRYPMIIFFWGEDYDLDVAEFEESLRETGIGVLEHPIYGVADVIPFGTIKRRDDLKTAANQAVLELTFWETIGLVYPSSQRDPGSGVLLAVEEYNVAVSEEFEDEVDVKTVSALEQLKSLYKGLLNSAKSGLRAIADAQEDVQRQFDAISDSIEDGLDTLIGAPLRS